MILFYDVEVFKYQSCVIFKNLDGETVRMFTNNLDGLGEYVDRGVLTHLGYKGLKDFISDKKLYGYNNYNYDDYILYAMIMELPQSLIKEWNDNIISGSKINMKKLDHPTYDLFQQIDVSRPSLKKIEGNLGKNIYESAVPFDIDRPLSSEENLEVVKYCENDVQEVITIYNLRKAYFSSKQTIINMLDHKLQERAEKWNTTSIVGQILAPRIKAPHRRLVSDDLLELVPSEVKDMWLELDTTFDFKFKTKKVVVDECGCLIEFGWGGLHGAPRGVVDVKNIKLYDVASMYPSILIMMGGLGDKTGLYEKIKLDRIRIKREGTNKELDAAYKLILNSTYGILNNQYSQVNNPYVAYSICIYGQISLYVLSQMLYHKGCRIININTDGVAFEPDVSGQYPQVIDEWTHRFKLDLDLDEFSRWIQKDVNNYIAVTTSGAIKTKGGDVNNYLDYEEGGRNYYFNNSNIRIVQKALVDYLIRDVDPAETVFKYMERPELYQYILQAGPTYKGTVDEEGNYYQKVNRVFATREESLELHKKRVDGGLVKFPDAPRKMYLHNEDLSELKGFKDWIDLDWYYSLALKAIERWEV